MSRFVWSRLFNMQDREILRHNDDNNDDDDDNDEFQTHENY